MILELCAWARVGYRAVARVSVRKLLIASALLASAAVAVPSPARAATATETPGTVPILDWSVSRALPAAQVRPDDYPSFYGVFLCGFADLRGTADGWCDLTIQRGGGADEPLCALARCFFQPERETELRLDVGAPGDVRLYLNGFPLPPAATSRVPDGSAPYVLLLRPGLNEILLKVYSAPAGWGFRVLAEELPPPPHRAASPAIPVWETDAVFLTSESVVHDPDRGVLYVSSFDNQYARRGAPSGFLSRLNESGELLDEKWIVDLEAPCGLALCEDRLYVAERHALAVIDVRAALVVARHALTAARFPNDVAVDAQGCVYVSDTRPNPAGDAVSIWRLEDGGMQPWLVDPTVGRANGLCVAGDELLVGSSADGCLKAVNLQTRTVRTVASLGAGVVDGIRPDGQGGVLVSLWQGRIFRVGLDGQPVELIDLQPTERNTADFWFLPDAQRLLIPTFLANTVAAYDVSF